MTNKKSDLRAEILTNELGNQMLDTVAPIYNNSKVTLYLFQTMGLTLEMVKDFFSFSFTNLPSDDSKIYEESLSKEVKNGVIYTSSFNNVLPITWDICRAFVIDNTSKTIICDEIIQIKDLTKDTNYQLESDLFSISYKWYTSLDKWFSISGEIDSADSVPEGDYTFKLYKLDEVPSGYKPLTNRLNLEDNFISQIFFQTATWGLEHWEDEYGITPDPSLSYEQRRQNLITKIQYTAPITPRKIADRISSLFNIPVTVKEIAGNSFEIVLSKLVLDHSELYEIVDRIAPAHLIYDVKTVEEDNSAMTNYYKISVSEMESGTVIVRYTVLTDENDYILTNELDEVLTV